jgi:hypothetical protein
MRNRIVALLLALAATTALTAKNHGGVNLNAQCARQTPGSRAVMVDDANKVTKQNSAPNRAYSWRCQLKDGSLQSMNLNAACAAQHGATAKAEAFDKNDAYSWKCISPDPVSPAIATGSMIDYKNYRGQTEKLYAYPGARSAVLLPVRLSPAEAPQVTRIIDSCSAVFADMSVRGWPSYSLPQFPGKSSVAVVKATCGAGCGAGGRAEIQINEFTEAQKRMGSITNALTWQVGYYELGRGGSNHKNPGFVFYPALDPSAGHDVVASAFPEFAMSVCVDRLGVTPAAYEQSNKTVGYPRGPGVVEFGRRFRATKFTFTEAYEKDRNGFYRGWALSSLLFDLYLKFGYDRMKIFMANLAAIATESGQVKSHVAVSKNLLEAARRTGGEAMVSYLRDSWRVLE